MSDYRGFVRQLLSELLSNGPQLGSRLKLQLSREFERVSGQRFDVLEGGFPNFTAFLAANADLVEVIRQAGPGDVTVRLKSTARETSHEDDLLPAPAPRQTRIPAELWQAFTNPDHRRRRFYNRTTRRVVHFVEGADSELDRRLSAEVAADKNFVKIDSIPGSIQTSWMHAFLESVSLPEGIRKTCGHLASAPYASAVNTAFTVALAEYGGAWKHFRASKVLERVDDWAAKHSINLHDVTPPEQQLYATAYRLTPSDTGIVTDGHPESELRRQLHALIDALEDRELDRVLIPMAVVSRFLKARP